MTEDVLLRDLAGTWLVSRYELRALVGEGGMGRVYEAVDHELGRTVAIKVLRDDLATDRRLLSRFRREARMSARLSHPGIVAVYDIGGSEERAFIVMEFVTGRTLGSIIGSGGPLPPSRAAWVTEEVAEALAHAHDQGVVHRDISPSNIMLTPGGAIKVLDFGIARTSRTSTGPGPSSVHGTVPYVAPERARGEAGDGRADIYAVGAVLHELLTGRPWTEGNGSAGPRMTGVQPALEAIVGRCLQGDPDARFQSASELAAALREARGAPVTAPIRRSKAHPVTAPLAPPVRTAVLPTRAPTDRRARRIRPGKILFVLAVALAIVGATWVVGSAVRRAFVVEPTVHQPVPVPSPTGLTVTTACSGWLSTRADLAWTPGGPSGGYEVWRQQGASGFVLVARIADWHTTSFSDRHLGVDVTYDYLVRAVRGKRTSAAMTPVPASTPLLCLT